MATKGKRRPTARNDLTAEYVRSILELDKERGVFRWKHRGDRDVRWNGRWGGRVAGSVRSDGYRHIAIDGRRYLEHRLAWLWVNGEWPRDEIDHEDTDKTNGSFRNLREATHAENARNRGLNINNTSGHKGVWFEKSRGLWVAEIKLNRKKIHLGRFKTAEEAATARAEVIGRLHGQYAHRP